MCGIAGLAGHGTRPLAEQLAAMARALRHRGPDDDGIWIEDQLALGFAHTRLSIIDLSPAGHQPMTSAHGRYVIAFNGEIYNYRDLRRELEQDQGAPDWIGQSDTEVLLAGFEHWGIEQTLRRTNGMFALAVWDTRTRQLTLARDRMGEKPLYFGWLGARFVFASELKALHGCDGWPADVDPAVAADFLRYGYVRGPKSIIAGIFRLPPGTSMMLEATDLGSRRDWAWLERRIQPFWSLAEAAERGLEDAFAGSPGQLVETLDRILRDAVASRMVADVPLGALLSGGIDSSLVTAMMQAQAAGRVRTFSIGFGESDFDEAPHARAVARHLGTDHTELYVSPGDALELIPSLPQIYDEPFADVSQIPTVLLARLTRRHVKVALSGDGGDELFAGYARYFAILKLWRIIGRVPGTQRHRVAATIKRMAPYTAWIDGLHRARQPFPFRLNRLASRLSSRNPDELRNAFLSGSLDADWARDDGAPASAAAALPPGFVDPLLRRLMYADQADYLPDDIMVKMDRATMASGLESRAPLLDHRLIEFSWRLPLSELHHGTMGKRVFRDVLHRYVPRELLDRPKQGFDVPIGSWLRGPLKAWADDLLGAAELRHLPFLDMTKVQQSWRQHAEGRISVEYALWSLLMLAAWMRSLRPS
jgi:asparagine synthase (glutamine-hydrolysing)